MKRLQAWWAILFDNLVVGAQRLVSLVRGGFAWHIVITGPDLVGMKHLALELGRLVPELKLSSSRHSAQSTATIFAGVVASVDPDDITRSRRIEKTIGRFRKAVVIAPTADPRDMVCARWPELAHQWAEGFDYRFLLGSEGTKSFTEPGVLPRFEGLATWRDTGASIVSPAREVLEKDISSVFHQLADALPGPRSRRVRDALRKAASSAAPLPKTPRWHEDKESTKRALGQIVLGPALEETALALGYEPKSSLTKARAPKASRGTIIAFHTPDEVYRAEAARLKSTLDALGLDYKFFEVKPEGNWVRTTLLKPHWISKAREELSGPLLYIDVDAFVHNDPWPYLSQFDGDMAAVVYNNAQLNSATLLINDTKNAREVLSRWKNLADQRRDADQGDLEASGDNGDQGVLKIAVLNDETTSEGSFAFQRLPVNMAYIFDRTETYCVGPIFIEQLQASRESGGHDKRLARRRERLLQLEAGATSTQ